MAWHQFESNRDDLLELTTDDDRPPSNDFEQESEQFLLDDEVEEEDLASLDRNSDGWHSLFSLMFVVWTL